RLNRVLHFLIASNVGIALRASEGTVTLNHCVCVAGWVVGDSVESAVRARPFLSGELADVWVVLNPRAKSVVRAFCRLDVPAIVGADFLLRLHVAINSGLSNFGVVFVALGLHAETLAECVEGVGFEREFCPRNL